MSIGGLVTRGFSNGSFIGSIAEIVTQGYDIAVIITSPTVVIIKFEASNNVIKIQESDRDINVINPNRRIIF